MSHTHTQQQDGILANPHPNTTSSKDLQILYTWEIPDFQFHETLQSPTFSPKGSNEPKFCLTLHGIDILRALDSDYYDPPGNVQVDIHLVSHIHHKIKTKFNIWVLSRNSSKLIIMNNMNTNIIQFNSKQKCFSYIVQIVNLQQHPTQYHNNDTCVTVLCEGIVLANHLQNGPEVIGRFCDNLGMMVNNEKFSDVTLAVDGKEIPAHKLIMAAQSTVFAAMFDSNMEETKQNRVSITDIDYEVLKEMLRFMYTCHAPSLDKMARELLAVADKYAMENLKAMCEQSLFKNISIENACHTVCLADLHSANQLKKATIDYITDKSRIMDVMKTAGWKDMTPTHSNIIAEVLQVFATKQLLP